MVVVKGVDGPKIRRVEVVVGPCRPYGCNADWPGGRDNRRDVAGNEEAARGWIAAEDSGRCNSRRAGLRGERRWAETISLHSAGDH